MHFADRGMASDSVMDLLEEGLWATSRELGFGE
jgi:hypothetical protein